MKDAIVELLKESEISQSNNKIKDVNINDFSDIVKEIGKKETQYIKASEISKKMNTDYIGKNLYIYNEVTSTNTIAKYLCENGTENAVVISEKQTSGRGRSGKSWKSPLGGVWLSIIITPNISHTKLPLITLATGVAVAKTLEKIGVENPEIKWPNDIIINDKKICGILTEAITKFNNIKNVIIGVGIDANLNIDEIPKDLQDIATSLEIELKRKIDVNLLIKLFLEEFEEIIEIFNREKYEEILKQWRERSYTIGKIVEVRKPYHEHYDAYVTGIGKEGALIVEKDDGSLEKVISGECIIKK